MSDGRDRLDPLFRPEALEHALRGRSSGALLRLSPAWKHWAFGVLVAAFAGALVLAARVPFGADVAGPARIVRAPDGLEAVCLLPAGARAQLRPGQRAWLRLERANRTAAAASVVGVGGEALGAEGVRAALGEDARDLPPFTPPVVVVRVRLNAGAGAEFVPGTHARASVRVGERTLLQALRFPDATR